MLRAISDLLNYSLGLKGRQIAKELRLEKSQVNSFLQNNQDKIVEVLYMKKE